MQQPRRRRMRKNEEENEEGRKEKTDWLSGRPSERETQLQPGRLADWLHGRQADRRAARMPPLFSLLSLLRKKREKRERERPWHQQQLSTIFYSLFPPRSLLGLVTDRQTGRQESRTGCKDRRTHRQTRTFQLGEKETCLEALRSTSNSDRNGQHILLFSFWAVAVAFAAAAFTSHIHS